MPATRCSQLLEQLQRVWPRPVVEAGILQPVLWLVRLLAEVLTQLWLTDSKQQACLEVISLDG